VKRFNEIAWYGRVAFAWKFAVPPPTLSWDARKSLDNARFDAQVGTVRSLGVRDEIVIELAYETFH
jgi:hypothetical protein